MCRFVPIVPLPLSASFRVAFISFFKPFKCSPVRVAVVDPFVLSLPVAQFVFRRHATERPYIEPTNHRTYVAFIGTENQSDFIAFIPSEANSSEQCSC